MGKFLAGFVVGSIGFGLVVMGLIWLVFRTAPATEIGQFGKPTPVTTGPEGGSDNLTPLASTDEQVNFRLIVMDSGAGAKTVPAEVIGLTWTIKKVELGLDQLGMTRTLTNRPLTNHWESLPLAELSSIDLLSLRGSGNQVTLVDTPIIIGRYHTLRLTLENIQAKLTTGEKAKLELNSKNRVIELTQPLIADVQRGPVSIILDIDSRASLTSNFDQDTLDFQPVIRNWNLDISSS